MMPVFETFLHYPKYPTHTEMFNLKPNFVYATCSSAFNASKINYIKALNVETYELVIASNVYGTHRTYCHQELHATGIETYLITGYCE